MRSITHTRCNCKICKKTSISVYVTSELMTLNKQFIIYYILRQLQSKTKCTLLTSYDKKRSSIHSYQYGIHSQQLFHVKLSSIVMSCICRLKVRSQHLLKRKSVPERGIKTLYIQYINYYT